MMTSKPNYNRYKRGQIWRIFRDPKETRDRIEDKDNHLQEKTRTWLIVSVDISNDKAPILNCVPMTTKLRELPCHVKVQMEGFLCNILCEHVTTINKSDLTTAEFVGVLDESSMQRVEVALANQLGLSIQTPSLEVLKRFVERLANMKAQELKVKQRQVTDDLVIDLASRLDSMFDLPKEESSGEDEVLTVEENSFTDEGESTETLDEVDDIESTEEEITPKEVVESPAPKEKSSGGKQQRNKWTEESMREFLADFDKYSSEEMQKRYGMSMKSLYTTRSRFKGLLSESKS